MIDQPGVRSALIDPPDTEEDDDEAMPLLRLTRRTLALGAFFVVSLVAFLYFVLPQLAGLDDTWNRINSGNPWWLAVAFVFTVLSFAGYVLLFQGVYVRADARETIGLAESYQITMAGLAATRLFAAGGAGGLVLTAWALRRSGMKRRAVADSTIAFLVLMYVVYMLAIVVCGIGLRTGVFEGPSPFAMTVVPAFFAFVIIVLALLAAFVPTDLQRRLEGFAQRGGRLARGAQRAAHAPAALSAGVREAFAHMRSRDPSLVGSIAFWGFSIATLWASFHAFGEAPPLAVIVMAYFVGMLGNLLPLPGGIGGVDGGMIGAFAALSVSTDLAIVSVLTYRVFAFWLPTIPGAIAYFQLRRTVARWSEERVAARGAPAPAGA